MRSEEKAYYALKKGADIGNRIVTGLTLVIGALLAFSIAYNVMFS